MPDDHAKLREIQRALRIARFHMHVQGVFSALGGALFVMHGHIMALLLCIWAGGFALLHYTQAGVCVTKRDELLARLDGNGHGPT